jgi:hypothetical protein
MALRFGELYGAEELQWKRFRWHSSASANLPNAQIAMVGLSGSAHIGSTVLLWSKYGEYREAVKRTVPQHGALRDKDRFLWGRSAAWQLVADIASGFSRK